MTMRAESALSRCRDNAEYGRLEGTPTALTVACRSRGSGRVISGWRVGVRRLLPGCEGLAGGIKVWW
jgi:hypothetical protein